MVGARPGPGAQQLSPAGPPAASTREIAPTRAPSRRLQAPRRPPSSLVRTAPEEKMKVTPWSRPRRRALTVAGISPQLSVERREHLGAAAPLGRPGALPRPGTVQPPLLPWHRSQRPSKLSDGLRASPGPRGSWRTGFFDGKRPGAGSAWVSPAQLSPGKASSVHHFPARWREQTQPGILYAIQGRDSGVGCVFYFLEVRSWSSNSRAAPCSSHGLPTPSDFTVREEGHPARIGVAPALAPRRRLQAKKTLSRLRSPRALGRQPPCPSGPLQSVTSSRAQGPAALLRWDWLRALSVPRVLRP